jgi:hypothetical protein
MLNVDTVFDPVAPRMGDGDPKPWFWDSQGGIGVTDVELSRDERTVVGIAGFTDQLLRVYRPLFDPYDAPAQDLTPWGHNTPVVEPCAELSSPAGGRFSSPTLSPDGHGLAFADADGVHTMALPDLSGSRRAANTCGSPAPAAPTGAPPTCRAPPRRPCPPPSGSPSPSSAPRCVPPCATASS